MKILVTGASGMLGQELVRTAQNMRIDVVGLTHQELDICDPEAIWNAFAIHKPEVLVNCAGIVKGREVESDLYYWVNAQGPKVLSLICEEMKVKMVQISTDCVFQGLKPSSEEDKPDAMDTYGESKIMGELENHLTLRMSFIGIGERGLVNWLMKQSGTVDGYINFKWNGSTVHYAAINIILAILRDLNGIVHVCGEDTNKYEVLCYLNDALRLNLKIIPIAIPVVDRRLRTIYDSKFDTPSIKKQIEEMASDYCCNPCGA